MFFHFGQKFENSKWPPYVGRGNFLKIAKSTFLRYPMGQKFRRNRFISHGEGDRSNFVFCHFGEKFENSKGPPYVGRGNFLKIAKSTFLRYPMGQKFRRNRFISHGEGDRSNFVFCHFGEKFENSKGPPYVGRGKFLKIAKSTFLRYPVGRKFRRNPSISYG